MSSISSFPICIDRAIHDTLTKHGVLVHFHTQTACIAVSIILHISA